MEITGEQRIPASRETVWRALNDPEVLRRSIPGCETLDKLSDTEFTGTITAKVGPVKAKFGGKVTLSEIDPPNGYVLAGQGQGAAGFAKGEAAVRLRDDSGQTVLSYSVRAQVGGKLAQVGARLLEGATRKLADSFFVAFGQQLGAPAEAAVSAAAEAMIAEAAPGLSPWVWAAGLLVVVALLWWFFGS